ncbi:ethionine resistance protein, partial [Friedmanniomyces endolithicus]
MENRQDETQSARSWLPGFLRPADQRYDSKKTDASRPPDERSSLLPKPDDTGEGETYEVEDESKSRTRRIATEFWVLFKASIPVILAYTLQNSLQTVSVLIVGRLSPEALSVAAFSYMFAMATAWLIGMG